MLDEELVAKVAEATQKYAEAHSNYLERIDQGRYEEAMNWREIAQQRLEPVFGGANEFIHRDAAGKWDMAVKKAHIAGTMNNVLEDNGVPTRFKGETTFRLEIKYEEGEMA